MTKENKYYDIARAFAVLGATFAILGFIWGLIKVISSGGNFESLFLNIVTQIVGVLVSILILISTDFIRKFKYKMNRIPFNWWMLLIFACIQAWMTFYAYLLSLATLGIILEIFAVILLLVDVLYDTNENLLKEK